MKLSPSTTSLGVMVLTIRQSSRQPFQGAIARPMLVRYSAQPPAMPKLPGSPLTEGSRALNRSDRDTVTAGNCPANLS